MLSERVSGYNTQITNLQTSINNTNTNVTNLSSRVDAVEDQIESIGSGASASAFEVIYDKSSTDENINLGFTMGLQGGYTIVLDTTKYRYLRVYATLDGYEAQTFVSIVDTEKLEFYLKANNPASMYFYSMRFSLTTNHNFFSSGQYCKYEFSTSTGTFKRTLAARSSDYYIYKIEGYF